MQKFCNSYITFILLLLVIYSIRLVTSIYQNRIKTQIKHLSYLYAYENSETCSETFSDHYVTDTQIISLQKYV